ncbi:MAG: cytochrome [Verrucomicrobiales bacterium]|nr:cytochrome [Verrucomicrobiales bacterium]
MKHFFLIAGLVATSVVAQAEVVKIELPVETAVYKSGPGADLANAQCLTCHSADYILMQPPMPAKFWKGAVDKMIGKYAAPIPTNSVDALVEYFAKNYGTETNTPSNTVVTQVITQPSGALDGEAVATKMGCFNCHAEDKKIGPAYKAVAAKYKGNKEGPEKIAHQITHGGSGQWGTVPMPQFDSLSAAEIKAVSDWILAQ